MWSSNCFAEIGTADTRQWIVEIDVPGQVTPTQINNGYYVTAKRTIEGLPLDVYNVIATIGWSGHNPLTADASAYPILHGVLSGWSLRVVAINKRALTSFFGSLGPGTIEGNDVQAYAKLEQKHRHGLLQYITDKRKQRLEAKKQASLQPVELKRHNTPESAVDLGLELKELSKLPVKRVVQEEVKSLAGDTKTPKSASVKSTKA
jgi:hypothetical protein